MTTPEKPGFESNQIVLRAEVWPSPVIQKIAAFIPMTAQMFLDTGLMGDRGEAIDPDGIWRQRWTEHRRAISTASPSASGLWDPFVFNRAPAYESWDKVRVPEWKLLPRLTALEARLRGSRDEVVRRARLVRDGLRGIDHEDRDGYDW